MGFDVAGSTTQIVPLVIGDAALSMRVCEAALERGVFAQAIRPPTVPQGTSRLRLAVMASHTKDELRQAARVLGKAAATAGLRPGDAPRLPTVERRAAAPDPVFDAAPRGNGSDRPLDGSGHGDGAGRPFDGEATEPARRAA